MTNISIEPLWLTYFIGILLVLEFQLTKSYFGTFSYKAHFRPQISSNGQHLSTLASQLSQNQNPEREVANNISCPQHRLIE